MGKFFCCFLRPRAEQHESNVEGITAAMAGVVPGSAGAIRCAPILEFYIRSATRFPVSFRTAMMAASQDIFCNRLARPGQWWMLVSEFRVSSDIQPARGLVRVDQWAGWWSLS